MAFLHYPKGIVVSCQVEMERQVSTSRKRVEERLESLSTKAVQAYKKALENRIKHSELEVLLEMVEEEHLKNAIKKKLEDSAKENSKYVEEVEETNIRLKELCSILELLDTSLEGGESE